MRRSPRLLFGAALMTAMAATAQAAPMGVSPAVLTDGPAATILQAQTSNENYAIQRDRWHGGYSYHQPRGYYPPAYSYHDYDPYPRYRVYQSYRPYHYYPHRYRRGSGITLQFSF